MIYIALYFLIGIIVSFDSTFGDKHEPYASPTESRLIDFISFIPLWPLVVILRVQEFIERR